jgi:hypothetical protein
MKTYELARGAKDLSGLKLVERADPKPGPRQVLLRVHATSINFRDLAVVLVLILASVPLGLLFRCPMGPATASWCWKLAVFRCSRKCWTR